MQHGFREGFLRLLELPGMQQEGCAAALTPTRMTMGLLGT